MGKRRELYNVVLCQIVYLSIKLSEIKSDSIKPKFITREMKLIMTRHHLILCLETSNKKDEYNHNTGRAIQTKIMPWATGSRQEISNTRINQEKIFG